MNFYNQDTTLDITGVSYFINETLTPNNRPILNYFGKAKQWDSSYFNGYRGGCVIDFSITTSNTAVVTFLGSSIDHNYMVEFDYPYPGMMLSGVNPAGYIIPSSYSYVTNNAGVYNIRFSLLAHKVE